MVPAWFEPWAAAIDRAMRYSTNATSGLVRWRCTVCRKKSPGMGSEARARDAATGHYIGAHMGPKERR